MAGSEHENHPLHDPAFVLDTFHTEIKSFPWLQLPDVQVEPGEVPIFEATRQSDTALHSRWQTVPELTAAIASAELGDQNDLFSREFMYGNEALPPEVLRFIFGWHVINNEPLVVRSSDYSLVDPYRKELFLMDQAESVAEALSIPKTEITIPVPLRTVSLSYPSLPDPRHPDIKPKHTALISCATDRPFVSDDVKFKIGKLLGVSRKKAKSATVNDPHFNPGLRIGMQPGIVGPMVMPSAVEPGLNYASVVAGVFYIPNGENPHAPVEIAASRNESIFMRRRSFESLLGDYAAARYPKGKFTIIR